MSDEAVKLRALLAYNNSRHWYPRGRFVSLVPDDSPYSASHPFRHVANFPDHDMTELACAAVNALPELLDEVEVHRKVAAELNAFIADRDRLLAIAEAAMAFERGSVVDEDDLRHRLRVALGLDAARKAGT